MITLGDLVSLARSYFKNVCIYNHDDINQTKGNEDVKHDSANKVAQLLQQKISEMLEKDVSTLYFVFKNDDSKYYLVCLSHDNNGDKAYINGEIVTVDINTDGENVTVKKINKFSPLRIQTSFQYINNRELKLEKASDSDQFIANVVLILNSAKNIIAVFEDDDKYNNWNKVTRRLLVNEIENKSVKVSYCKQNFLLEGETEKDLDFFSTDCFLYNRTDLNEVFYIYDKLTFYCLLVNEKETLITRIEKEVIDDTTYLTIGEGTARQIIIPSSISKSGKIMITIDKDTGLYNGTYEIVLLIVHINMTQFGLASRYDVRSVIFKTQDGNATIKNRYIGKVTKELVKKIPEYKKFEKFDIQPISPSENDDEYKYKLEKQFNLQNNVTFYGLDVDTSMLLLQADNTTQGSVGYPDEKSGLTIRYIDDKKNMCYYLLPNDLEKACYIDEKRVNQYMCGDYDYTSADKDGLVFNSKLVKSLDSFNCRFVLDSGDKYDICNIKAVKDNEVRLPFSLLCNMNTYKYFLSDCYKEKYNIPVGKDNKPTKFDNFTPYSVNSDYLPSKLKDIDCKLTFNTMFSTIKRSGYERWMLAFQLNLTNIDAVDKDTVYFDDTVKFGETRHVYVYIVKAKVPFIIFKHAEFDGTEVYEVASINLVKLNDFDAIECKTKEGERFVISGSDKNGKLYTMRGGNLERCLPINALADFDKRNENYNVYKCTITSLYVDYDSKKLESAPSRKEAEAAFIHYFIPNRDIRQNDQYTVKDFYSFCTERIEFYRLRIRDNAANETLADPGSSGGYTSIAGIYGDFETSYGGTDQLPPLASLYLFIGIEYTYKYKKGTSPEYSIPHYYEKLIRYEIKSEKILQLQDDNNNIDYGIKSATVHNMVTYVESSSTYSQNSYDYDISNSTKGLILINKEGNTTYTIDFGNLIINTLENLPIQGDLATTVKNGTYDDIADYLENNGIDMYQVNTYDNTSTPAGTKVYPIDFVDIQDTTTTTDVVVSKALVRCIPTKVKTT